MELAACGTMIAAIIVTANTAFAQPGWVLSQQCIANGEGGMDTIPPYEQFGYSAASLGDLDGDGVGDLAVGAYKNAYGRVWILFLHEDGTVKSYQRIGAGEGGFTGFLGSQAQFYPVASLGDLDGDGVADIAVGACRDDDGGRDRGAVWILFLNTDGTVKSHQKISALEGGFTGELDDWDWFGIEVGSLGDLDGDGVTDLAVGAIGDDDAGTDWCGGIWILFLNDDGTVKGHEKVATPDDEHACGLFGHAITSLGYLDGDDVIDIAVGAKFDDEDGHSVGAVWILFLNADGTVKAYRKINDSRGGFTGALDLMDNFGTSVSGLGDIDGDGVPDLAVGAVGDDDGYAGGDDWPGAVYVLFLNRDGTVKGHQKISQLHGGFECADHCGGYLGTAVAALGDHDGDGATDLAVGAGHWGPLWQGALWILFLDGIGACLADVDGSSDIGFEDLLAVLADWGPCGDCPADIDDSGDVGFADLLAVIAEWGPCFPPPPPTGACCGPDGMCVDLSEADCADSIGGVFHGEDTSCATIACREWGADGWIVTAPFMWQDETCSEASTCTLSTSPDMQWEVTIPTGGTWTFSACATSFDSVLALGTAPCGNDIAEVDDTDGCGTGSVIERIELAAGVYSLTLEGVGSSSCGEFWLEVTSP